MSAISARTVAVCIVLGSLAALTPTASADSGPVTASATAAPVCALNQAEQSTINTDFQSGMTAAAVCGTSGLQAAMPAATSDATTSPCGTLSEAITPNDPKDGWFHEEDKIEVEGGVLESGYVTAAWANFNTGGSNQYTWTILEITSDWSGNHSVYSHAGLIASYSFSNSAVYHYANDTEYACSGTTATKEFGVQ